jgi:hypothetical protein
MPECGDQNQVFPCRAPGDKKKSNSAEKDMQQMEAGDDEI